MPQDHDKKHQYEGEAQARKLHREEQEEEAVLDDELLHPGLSDEVGAVDVKKVHEILSDWHKDDVRKLVLVEPGTRLTAGHHYADLRDYPRREHIATGEETVPEEGLFVAKSDVGYDIWDKLVK